MSLLSKKTLTKKLLSSKAFRKLYVWEHLKRSIPFQIRTLRDERGWSQERAAQELGKAQSVLSRIESPAYGKMSLQTLVEIAEGFDVGLLIKFVPFSRLVKEYEDVSASALSAPSVSDPEEAEKLQRWSDPIIPRGSEWVSLREVFFYTKVAEPAQSHPDVDHFAPLPDAAWATPQVISFVQGDTSTFLAKLERRRALDLIVPNLPPVTNTEILDYTSLPRSQ